MKILMLGWEYPPVKSGGLGTACYGLTKELAALGQDIIFVAPYAVRSEKSRHLSLVNLNNYKLRTDVNTFSSLRERILKKINLTEEMKKHVTYEFISSLLNPYMSEESYLKKYSQQLLEIRNYLRKSKMSDIVSEVNSYDVDFKGEGDSDIKNVYGENLFQEVHEYALKAECVGMKHDFDLIVAHDWMTFEAAVRLKKATGKPLCVHIHATEFDRTGGHNNQLIYDLEYMGLHGADLVIANSHITKENCVKHYRVPEKNIIPIHLAIDKEEVSHEHIDVPAKASDEKIVLFLGRITHQKGPEFFLKAAAKVVKFYPNVKFVMAGSGEKLSSMIELAGALKISDKVFFTGFLEGEDIRKVLKMSDLFVLSSVAEPFGLVVLEAIKAEVPCIVSNTAGVAEILNHVMKFDFWDINEMANQIVNILKYESLAKTLEDNSSLEAEVYTWNWTAKKTLQVYEQVLQNKSKENTYA